MSNTLIAGTLVELGAAVVALIVARLAWNHRQKPAGFPVVTMALAAVGWALASALESLIADLGVSIALITSIYLMTDIVAVSWLYITVEYTGRRWFQQRRVIAGILSISALNVAILLTDPIHGLIFLPGTELTAEGFLVHRRGLWFWLRAAWSYGIIFVGMGLLAAEIRNTAGMNRLQAVIVLLGGTVPTVAATIEVLELLDLPGFNVSSVGITLSGAILLWALFYADFLEVVPVARKTLMDNMDDAVIAVDSQQRVIDYNPIAQTLFEIDDNLLGAPGPEAFAEYPAAVDRIETIGEGELTLEHDGETRYYGLKSSPIETESEMTTLRSSSSSMGTVVVIRDITTRKRKQHQLERANRQLEQFASFVSHDLRNPLGIAEMYTDFAEESGDSDDFDAIREALDRMDEMIADLLELARIDEDSVTKEPVSLEDVANAAWGQVDTRTASLTMQDTNTVSADREYLLHVFENLFRNAVDHGPEGVTVTVGSLENDFYISDDGPGIPPGERDEIFDHGYTSSEDGNGFGLSLVDTIVSAHDWTITITESSDGGARFEIQTEV